MSTVIRGEDDGFNLPKTDPVCCAVPCALQPLPSLAGDIIEGAGWGVSRSHSVLLGVCHIYREGSMLLNSVFLSSLCLFYDRREPQPRTWEGGERAVISCPALA